MAASGRLRASGRRAPSMDDLFALVAALQAENASLKARLAELERRLGFEPFEQRQASVE